MTDNSIYRQEAEQVRSDYFEGKITLNTLVQIFERYVRARELENAPDSEKLRSAWFQIEIVNAINFDEPDKVTKNEPHAREFIREFLEILP